MGNLNMVYQFLFDEFLFHTYFSEMQYWGIGICVLTFILDIYMTMQEPEKEENEGDQAATSLSESQSAFSAIELGKKEDRATLPTPLLNQAARRDLNSDLDEPSR